MPVACTVTLRATACGSSWTGCFRWSPTLDKDFRGVSGRGFDGNGNYNLGLREQLIFPEISYDKVIRTRGMNVSFATSANTDEEAQALLREMGFPFTR